MTRRVYDLIWQYPAVQAATATEVNRGGEADLISEQAVGVRAIILAPSLFSPIVLSSTDEDLELLLLAHEDDTLTPAWVDLQLKVSEGLLHSKPCHFAPLFGSDVDQHIRIGGPGNLNDSTLLLRTASDDFIGIMDRRAFSALTQRGYRKLYQVTISNPFAAPNRGMTMALNCYETPLVGRRRYVRGDLQDQYIGQMLGRLNRDENATDRPINRIPGGGLFSFRARHSGVDISRIDWQKPIVAFHPVVVDPGMGYMNLGHVSDIHVSSRQDYLSRSNARVIDYQNGGGDADTDVSPEIGPLTNKASQNLQHILNRMGGDAEIHAVLVGGDMIDYIRNSYLSRDTDLSRAGAIWQHLRIDARYHQRYKRFVDFIALYSIVVRFYNSYKKPIFAVRGNHDAYLEPYGVSPRKRLGPIEQRANEGIPADHNLTIYEAVLAFGDTYHEVRAPLNPPTFSPMNVNMFEWYHGVFTAFVDFSVKLPRQDLVCMGWSEAEKIIDVPPSNHGFGHLPRDPRSMNDRQYGMLDGVVRRGRKVILMTHFTFVSYKDSIALLANQEGDIEYDSNWDPSEHDFGTFELRRRELYHDLMYRDRRIQTVLTGHSHRRGLYFVTDRSTWGEDSVKARFFDFNHFAAAKRELGNRHVPAVIVSDSGGSLPRYNHFGEFGGWGSHPATGTKVTYDDAGDISSVSTIAAPRRPRGVVALDYWDLIEDRNALATFESQIFVIGVTAQDLLIFNVELAREVSDWGLRVGNEIRVYGQRSAGGDWERVELTHQAGTNNWLLAGRDNIARFRRISSIRARRCFLGLKLERGRARNGNRLNRAYDFDSWWTFECRIALRPYPAALHPNLVVYYRVLRNKTPAEIPDFAERAQMDKYRANA